MRIKQIIFFILLAVFLLPGYSCGNDASGDGHKLIMFYSPSCHHCTKAMNEVMPDIEREFSGQITIEYRDIKEFENYKFFLGLSRQHDLPLNGPLPVFYLDDHFLTTGTASLKDSLRQAIIQALGSAAEQAKATGRPEVDLLGYFKSFTPLAVSAAGLIDGINPCAFTVIVFFISFLALQGYRKRDLVAIGLTFIFAVFLTYIFIGLGLFGFFYRLKTFWIAAKALNIGIGIFSIILGCLAVYDFAKFKKTRDTEGLVLQLPAVIKKRIHDVIGRHYRRTDKAQARGDGDLAALIASALVTGFLVSLLEAVCTGQTYLPTISFILKVTPFNLQALAYLLLYNLMFILPLLAVFLLALFGVTSGQFANVLKRHLLLVKALMALLFFGLGIFLLWRA